MDWRILDFDIEISNGAPSPTVSAYGASALERECREMAATGTGRNDRLNRAAFAIGHLVGAGEIERQVAERQTLRRRAGLRLRWEGWRGTGIGDHQERT